MGQMVVDGIEVVIVSHIMAMVLRKIQSTPLVDTILYLSVISFSMMMTQFTSHFAFHTHSQIL